MQLAITMAAKCNPDKPSDTPSVGAVVVIDNQVVALASRGKDDPAEKIALDEAVRRGGDLTKSPSSIRRSNRVLEASGVNTRTHAPIGWQKQKSKRWLLVFTTPI